MKIHSEKRVVLTLDGGGIYEFVRQAKSIMEHPPELLLKPVNTRQQQILYGLVFDELRTISKSLIEPKIVLDFRGFMGKSALEFRDCEPFAHQSDEHLSGTNPDSFIK